ncbi:MAG: hypothetical protein RIS82_1232 [Actinomycetota bacterium]|jgi:diguanylate cyclase (GGDEF)-like protein
MSNAAAAKRTRKKVFRVKVGHVILGLISAGSLVGLMLFSVSALAAHNVDERTLLNQESDASAMTFVQRESFNVILDTHDWVLGDASARDVQISRAMLGQRLAVVTQSGQATFDLTEPDYRSALAEYDKVILGLSDVPDDQRVAYERAHKAEIDEFASETRFLSQTFEDLTRQITEQAIAQRVQAEVIQAVLLVVGIISGGALGAWVTLDIIRGFRIIRERLREQRKDLELTRNRLLLVQKVDARCRELIQAINSGVATEDVITDLKEYLFSLTLDLFMKVEIVDNEITFFKLLQDTASDIGPEEHDFIEQRLHEVVQAAVTRDARGLELSQERDFDSLTKLPNRNSFTKSVEANIQSATAEQVVSIMLIDIDRFRDVNGSLGYEAGDVLLREVANRLEAFRTETEKVSRLSGDEFGLTGVYESSQAAAARAQELVKSLQFTTKLAGLDSEVSASVGVALSQPRIDDSVELARCASLAIYLAKEPGERSGFTIFSPTEHQGMLTTWQEEIAVRNALRSGEFVMHFQPIVSLETLQPIGVEALIRWQRPGNGLVPPDQFLPIVNRAGLTVELGSEVLRESLGAWSRSIASAFAKAGLPAPYVSINVEAPQLEDAAFADFVLAQAAKAHVPNSSIVLEVTERTLAGSDVVMAQLEKLRQAGVRIALDDFGTGYSNLGQAQKMPLDILKIDKSFLENIDTDERSHRMVSDVTNMAKGQNLKVTAEGIESGLVGRLLAGMKVDSGQGYHFSKALPEADLEAWVRQAISL